jgi:hypothetical protein
LLVSLRTVLEQNKGLNPTLHCPKATHLIVDKSALVLDWQAEENTIRTETFIVRFFSADVRVVEPAGNPITKGLLVFASNSDSNSRACAGAKP